MLITLCLESLGSLVGTDFLLHFDSFILFDYAFCVH